MTKPTYVLVHGAWHGSWCWRDLGLELDARGVSWRAVDLPSSSIDAHPEVGLKEDVAAVRQLCEALSSVILLGHSYGGTVITEAAPVISGLEQLIYIAALIPLVGESSTTAVQSVNVRTRLDDAIKAGGGVLTLDEQKATGALYNECTKDEASWALKQIGPQTLKSFRDERTSPATDVTSVYILCTNDRAVDPDVQAIMASRCDENLTLRSDHSPFLSHPKLLVDAILM